MPATRASLLLLLKILFFNDRVSGPSIRSGPPIGTATWEDRPHFHIVANAQDGPIAKSGTYEERMNLNRRSIQEFFPKRLFIRKESFF